MKLLCLILGLWVLGGCFLSAECHRGPRRQHDPRGWPPTLPPHNSPRFSNFSFSSREFYMFLPLPTYGPGFRPFRPLSSNPPYMPRRPRPRPPNSSPLQLLPQYNTIANISLTTATVSNSTDDHLRWWQRLLPLWQ
ncbi:submaxillary gland androgen-regulated protein 3A-like [Onychomys torridus]|uniref:submaxillary gland androgen-regulated protein 3A-like n=1 Tax=Onychomys torridus TaxID=38674 RepID=UPI00167F337F|nr:submaxillary gland androgen-regulated protein 3A-like [Onychomys torridus]